MSETMTDEHWAAITRSIARKFDAGSDVDTLYIECERARASEANLRKEVERLKSDHSFEYQACEIARAERDDARAEREELRNALELVAWPVCNRLCPTTWKTSEGRRHHEACEQVRAALGGK